MGKKFFLIVLGFAAMFSLVGAIVRFSVQDVAVGRDGYIAHAEDDDEEETEHEDSKEEDDKNEASPSSSAASSSKSSSTMTQSTTNTSVVTQEVAIERRTDSDGDGIFDDEDVYPTINDNIIVRDDNRNGIVDEYERSE